MLKAVEANQKIWRYLDFEKLKWLVEKRALFFAKASKMEDIEEGLVPSLSPKPCNRNIEDIQPYRVSWKEHVLMSCWRMDDSESSKAWREYLRGTNGYGVAIQSTYDRLVGCFDQNEVLKDKVREYIQKPFESFDDVPILYHQSSPPRQKIFIESVDYECTHPNWSAERWKEGEWLRFYHYIRKSPCFEWEKELRALTIYPEDSRIDGNGIGISVDLEMLIEKVILSPKIQGIEFQNEVKSFLSKHGLKVDICKSNLDRY